VRRCFRDDENENGENLYAEPPVPVDTRRVTLLLPEKKRRWRRQERLGLRSGAR